MEEADTMFLIAQYQVPRDLLKYVSYGRIVVDYIPQKDEPHRMTLTVGGKLIFYEEYVSTPTIDITAAKLTTNSTISTPGARYMCCNIKTSTWEHH